MRTIAHGIGALCARVCIVDDREFVPRREPLAIMPVRAAQDYASSLAANLPSFVLEYNREYRRNRQPFYRRLNKYRKP